VDFIEQLFGISPDGGSGALEALYLMVLPLSVGAAVFWRRRRRRRDRP
jgi:membrane protein implicated in regulation of membrane protease activity